MGKWGWSYWGDSLVSWSTYRDEQEVPSSLGLVSQVQQSPDFFEKPGVVKGGGSG